MQISDEQRATLMRKAKEQGYSLAHKAVEAFRSEYAAGLDESEGIIPINSTELEAIAYNMQRAISEGFTDDIIAKQYEEGYY